MQGTLAFAAAVARKTPGEEGVSDLVWDEDVWRTKGGRGG